MSTLDRFLTGDRTRADSARSSLFTLPSRTRTSEDELVERAGALHDRARFLAEDVADAHDVALDRQLEARTDTVATRSVPELLDGLAAYGFAWRDIARLVGVSVPALRKWRQGEAATGTNRRSLARLVAFVDLLSTDHLVHDVASWMEMPLGRSAVTGLEIYGAGSENDLLRYALHQLDSEQLLDRVDPAWRDTIDSRFEVVTEGDEPLIRMRQPPTS